MNANEPGISNITDFQLARSSGGRAQCLEELYERHSRRVYLLCLRMTANPADAEDLSQEVFLQLMRKLGSFRGESAFTSWLHRLTVNQVLMHYRKRKACVLETEEDFIVLAQKANRPSQLSQTSVVDRLILDCAIRRLSTRQRAVFLLHDSMGYNHRQIAHVLGCSVSISKSQLQDARIILRRWLQTQSRARSRL